MSVEVGTSWLRVVSHALVMRLTKHAGISHLMAMFLDGSG